MKKVLVCAVTGVVLLVACSEGEHNEEIGEDNGEEAEQDDAEVNADEETPSPQDILNDAITFYDDLTSLYVVLEDRTDVDEEQEEETEGSLSMNMRETQWTFVEDEKLFTRTELKPFLQGEEVSEEQAATILMSDLDDPTFRVTYDEGDDQAIRYETGEGPHQYNLRDLANRYGTLLEEAELTYIGEEEINGYQTYHIEAEINGQVSGLWFDQDTHFEIKTSRSEDSVQASVDTRAIFEVIEFEVDPAFDESLFQTPENVEVVDGELEDTRGE